MNKEHSASTHADSADHHGHDHCCCEHDHSPEPLPDGAFAVHAQMHEGASVASGHGSFATADPEALKQKLRNAMQALAGWVEETGGYIGHIKAGVTEEHTCMYSITLDELSQRCAPAFHLQIHLNAIAFQVPLAELQEQLERTFQALQDAVA